MQERQVECLAVLTCCLHTFAGRHDARQAAGRQQVAGGEAQIGHCSKLSRQLSQLTLASQATEPSSDTSSSIGSSSSRAVERQSSAETDTGYCSSSAVSHDALSLSASAQMQPRLSSPSSSLEPFSPRPGLHAPHSRGVYPLAQQQSPTRGRQDRDAGTKLIALTQKRRGCDRHSPKPEAKRAGSKAHHAKHSMQSTAQHAEVDQAGTGSRQERGAESRLDMQCSRGDSSRGNARRGDARRGDKQSGAHKDRAAAAASEVHKSRPARLQSKARQDYPSGHGTACSRHSDAYAAARFSPVSDSISMLGQHSRAQHDSADLSRTRQDPAKLSRPWQGSARVGRAQQDRRVSSMESPGQATKLQHDAEMLQRPQQPHREDGCPAARAQRGSVPVGLPAAAPSALQQFCDASAESQGQALHAGIAAEQHIALHESSRKQQHPQHMGALQPVGSRLGHHGAALLTTTSASPPMTAACSSYPATAVHDGGCRLRQTVALDATESTSVSAGSVTHPPHHSAGHAQGLSPASGDAQINRAGPHGHAIETSLGGTAATFWGPNPSLSAGVVQKERAGPHGHTVENVLADGAAEAPLAAEQHSAAGAQEAAPVPMQALLIALENMTNMGQQKLAALGQPHQPCPADAAVASVGAAATTAAAPSEAHPMLSHVMPGGVTPGLILCSCIILAAITVQQCLGCYTGLHR